MAKPRTMYDKIWDDHVVETGADGTSLLYIDRHLVHEVTSPQAFEGLRLSGRKVRAPEKTLAVVDHNIQTTDRSQGIADPESRLQVEQLAENGADASTVRRATFVFRKDADGRWLCVIDNSYGTDLIGAV